MGKQETTSFSDAEREVIQRVAMERGITFDQAAQQLVSEGLAKRVRKKTRRSPSSNVMSFRRR